MAILDGLRADLDGHAPWHADLLALIGETEEVLTAEE